MDSGFVQGLFLAGIGLVILVQMPGVLRLGEVGWSYFPWSDLKFHRDKHPIRFWLYTCASILMSLLMLGSGILLLLGLIAPFKMD